MGWPLAIVIAIVVIGAVAFLSTIVAGNASVAAEKAKGENGEQSRDNVKTIQSDLATLREKVDSIERMMREVG
jgi:outer membrane murein-binding lipoprotein Lpp